MTQSYIMNLNVTLSQVKKWPAPEQRKFWALSFRALRTSEKWAKSFRSTDAWIKAEEAHMKAVQDLMRFMKSMNKNDY